jgi:hypothetical protein
MANQHKDLIARVAESAEPQEIDYGSLISQVRPTDKVKESVLTASSKNPDEEAQKRKLAPQLGIPAGLIDNVKDAQREVDQQAYDPRRLVVESPKTADYISNPDKLSSMGLDSVQGMTQLERVISQAKIDNDTSRYAPNRPKTIVGAVQNAFGRAAGQAEALFYGGMGFAADVQGRDDIALNLLRRYTATQEKTAKAYPAAVPSFKDINSWADVPTYLLEGIIENGGFLAMSMGTGLIGKKTAEMGVKRFADTALTEAAKREAVKRAGVIGAAAGSGTGSVGMQTGMIYGDVFAETGEQRPGVAAAFGLATGALDAFSAFKGVQQLFGKEIAERVAQTAVQRYGVEGAKAMFREGSTEYMQTWLEKGAVSFVDGRPLLNEENLIESMDAFFKGGAAGGAIQQAGQVAVHIADRVTGKLETARAESRATESQERAMKAWGNLIIKSEKQEADANIVTGAVDALTELNDTVANLPARSRVPDLFQEFVETMVEDSNLTDLYVNSTTVMSAIETAGLTPAMLQEQAPVLAAQLQEAQDIGTDVRIPVQEYLAVFPGSGSEQTLLQEARVEPEGPTYKEAGEFYQKMGETFQQEIDTVERETRPVLTRQDFQQAKTAGDVTDPLVGEAQSYEQYLEKHDNREAVKQANRDEIEQTLMGQIRNVTRYTAPVQRSMITPVISFYETQAANLGISPMELYRRFPLRISDAIENAMRSLTQIITPLKGAPGIVTPNPVARRLADNFREDNRVAADPVRDYAEVNESRAKRIAAAYEDMEHAPNDPKVKAAYDALISETAAQYEALLSTGIRVEFIPEGAEDPYAASPRMAIDDVKNNNHLWVFPTTAGFGSGEQYAGNPLLAKTKYVDANGVPMLANDVFRVVHDYFGHIAEGVGFRAAGEENAWRQHSSMFSPLARRALTTETRGQNSWVNYGPYGERNRTAKGNDTTYADQKTGLLPDWVVFEGSGQAWIEDFRPDNIQEILQKDHWAILTAENPNSKPATPEQNAARMAELRAELDTIGAAYYEVDGFYDRPEKSLAVFGISKDQALALGKKFGQESVLTREGFIYQDGSINPTTGSVDIFETAPENYYSTIRFPDGAVSRFAVGIDFDTKIVPGQQRAIMFQKVDQTNTEAFKKWFGDSKVVDENGDPLVVYHGTLSSFDTFDKAAVGKNYGKFARGLHFTSEQKRANFYAFMYPEFYGKYSPNIVPAYLSMKNPLVIDSGEESPIAYLDENPVAEELLAGRDGIIVNGNGEQHFVVFEPEQIKSAVGNRGTFDPENQNIVMQSGKPGELTIRGTHYSNTRRATLNGDKYGTGLRGAEAEAVRRTEDQRLKSRVYFYVDEGNGTFPETGVGYVKHEVTLTNMYDGARNPLKLKSTNQFGVFDSNVFEAAVLDAGFDGYYIEEGFGRQGVAVVLGDAAKSIPVEEPEAAMYQSGPGFESWFEGSKVTTPEGKPRVVYHGTQADIGEFKPSGTYGDMYFFTGDQGMASKYAGAREGANVMPLYLSIKNPYYIDSMDQYDGQTLREAKAAGHDGAILRTNGEELVYVAFRPSQIKSAISNTGAFSGSDNRLMFQSTQLRRGTETLKRFGLDPTKSYTTREVAAALEARQRKKYGQIDTKDVSPEAKKKIASWMVDEVLFEMENPESSGMGWYSYKYQNAIDILAQDGAPELATDKAARDLFTALVAITSDGQKVVGNFAQAMDIYKNIRDNNVFESSRKHQRQASVDANLGALKDLYDTLGPEGLHEFLLQEKTVGELNTIAKEQGITFNVQYSPKVKLPMAAVIFGPKLGAFYANLMGKEGYLTMDRWWTRTFNRYRGTLLTAPTKGSLDKLRELLGDATLSDDQVISAAATYEEIYRKSGYKDKTPINVAANTVHRAAFGIQDSPARVSERTFMIDTVAEARKMLARRGVDISIADIQAVLWYYEKRLYGQLGARDSADVSYEDAARRVVALRGDYTRQAEADPAEDGEAVSPGTELYQAEGALGSFNLDTLTISLLSGANLSTFIHESGHFYLKMLEELSKQPNAPQGVIDDFNKTLDWFGVTREQWEGFGLEEMRPYHEQWAQSWERWNLEGQAPTADLQPLFSRFRAWLLMVYRSVEQFLKQNPLAGNLNDEIRLVFGRLIAAEDAIKKTAEARSYLPLFETAEEAGTSQAAFEAYVKLGKESEQVAVDTMQTKSMKDMRWLSNARSKAIRELQALAKVKRREIRAQVELEVMTEPVNQARTFMRTGSITNPDTGERTKISDEFKMNTSVVRAIAPDVDLADLRGMTSDTGVDPDLIAPTFGFTSGEQMIREILSAENAQEKIDGITDQRMLEENGELIDERAIQQAADEALHNEARARFMATGLKMLMKQGNIRQIVKAAKQAADTAIAGKRVRDVKPNQYLAAETRANKEAIKAAPTSPQKAAEAQRAALLNNQLARSAQEAVKDVEKALRYLDKFNSEGTRKNLDIEYLEQIDSLLEPFDLRRGLSLSTIDRNVALSDWVAQQEALGFQPIIDPEMVAEARRKSYKNMTVEEFRGLVDTIKQIEHLGRLKKKLLTAKDQREFDERISEARASIEANANRTVKQRETPNDVLGNVGAWVRQMAASHRKFASFIRELDGGKDLGVVSELLVYPMLEAGQRETDMKGQAAERMAQLFEPILANLKTGFVPGNVYARKSVVPGTDISMTHEQRIMFGMNWGNEGNRQRLLDGGLPGKRALSVQEARAILDTLTKEEWDFIQATWDFIAEYKPLIAEQERTLTGKTPEWVEPAEVETKFGTYRGGYFPAKYDAILSTRSDTLEAAADLRQAMQGAYNRASARDGYTKQRADEVIGRPILLSFNAVSRHVNEVVHRIAWQDWLIDAARVLKALDPDIRLRLGQEALREMQLAVRDIASGDAPATGPVDVAINRIRAGSSIVGMGWRFMTALLQPSGIFQSWARLDAKWTAIGIKNVLANPVEANDWVNANSPFMRNRAKTLSREVNEIMNTVRAGKNVSAVTASYFGMIAKMQRMIDLPTYLGAYHKALAELKYEDAASDKQRQAIEAKAHDFAAQTVIDTQTGGELKDLASVQRGSPVYKLFTNFYSYFSTLYNLNVENYRTKRFSNPAEFADFVGTFLLLNTMPAIYSVLLREAFREDCGWDDTLCLLNKYKTEQSQMMFGQMILLREVGAGVDVATGGNAYGYSGPAGLRFFADVYKAGQQAEQGEADFALFKSLNNVAGALLHYPAGQINTTTEGLLAINDGTVEGVDAILALIAGPPRD